VHPRGLLVLGYQAAGSAADNGKTSIFEGPTETAIFSGDMSQTGLQYKSAVLGRRRASGTKRPRTASLPERATRQTQPQTRIGTRSGPRPRSLMVIGVLAGELGTNLGQ
jgi:hypothetical protein